VSYDGPGSLEQILKCLQVMAVVGGVGGVPAELSCGDFGVLRQDPASARDALARFDAAASVCFAALGRRTFVRSIRRHRRRCCAIGFSPMCKNVIT